MRELGDVADYWTLNVSSPNTPGLRAQQSAGEVRRLVRAARAVVPSRPLFLKLAPDFEDAAFDALVEETADLQVDGLVLTNTTVGREDLHAAASLEGGLSGAPLFARSTELVRRARQRSGGKLAIIASGGVFGAGDALAKIRAGASLVQVYTGYVFEGPSLPRRVHRQLARLCRAEGCTIADLVGSQTGSERRAS
jgi:dihydroorotate dehydrogenase